MWKEEWVKWNQGREEEQRKGTQKKVAEMGILHLWNILRGLVSCCCPLIPAPNLHQAVRSLALFVQVLTEVPTHSFKTFQELPASRSIIRFIMMKL